MPESVGMVFASYPAMARRKLMDLRTLIYQTAASLEGVGELEETLKWGEPSYLTSQSKSGSTIRLGWKRAHPHNYYLYFNCNTSLVPSFRDWFARELASSTGELTSALTIEGNRALVFNVDRKLPTPVVAQCIEAALTYHQRKP